jgi:hypothetical protein
LGNCANYGRSEQQEYFATVFQNRRVEPVSPRALPIIQIVARSPNVVKDIFSTGWHLREEYRGAAWNEKAQNHREPVRGLSFKMDKRNDDKKNKPVTAATRSEPAEESIDTSNQPSAPPERHADSADSPSNQV